MRSFGREAHQLRPTKIEAGVSRNAEGSCLIQCGHTRVLCTATVEDNIPPFLRNTGKGWVTAEYGMLPRAAGSRNPREAARGKQSGRTQEIQRLIGRALRACINLEKLGERQIIIDCDVIEADGGTRCASITGGYVALHLALQKLVDDGRLNHIPLLHSIAAVSCGIVDGKTLLDLDYVEDSAAQVDANFILTNSLRIVEIQASGEEHTFDEESFNAMMHHAKTGIEELTALQMAAIRSV